MINEYYVNINLEQKDVIFLQCVLQDYKGIYKEYCETHQRCKKIIELLEEALHKE